MRRRSSASWRVLSFESDAFGLGRLSSQRAPQSASIDAAVGWCSIANCRHPHLFSQTRSAFACAGSSRSTRPLVVACEVSARGVGAGELTEQPTSIRELVEAHRSAREVDDELVLLLGLDRDRSVVLAHPSPRVCCGHAREHRHASEHRPRAPDATDARDLDALATRRALRTRRGWLRARGACFRRQGELRSRASRGSCGPTGRARRPSDGRGRARSRGRDRRRDARCPSPARPRRSAARRS